MSYQIQKLNPLHTVALRGFSGFGAAAALWGASDTGFNASGVFRDAADFTVIILYDADCFYEHPRLKYLPDFDFSGMALSFDLHYTNLQPIDSQKFPTIDWPYLDVTRADGSAAQVSLWDNASYKSGNYAAASGTFTIATPAVAGGDRLTLWFQNIAFDYFGVDHSGDTAAQCATTLAGMINATDWTGIGGLNALMATTANEQLTVTYARYGRVNTSGKTVTLTSGQTFVGLKAGDLIMIGGTTSTVVSATATTLQLSDDFGQQTGLAYLAPRGGYDGNMATMYSVSQTANLTATALVPFAGGSSDAVWTVSLDFTALGIDQVRLMWLTLAPRLTNGTAYVDEEFDAVFSNWTVSDPNGKRALKVAGNNSVRVEETDSWCKLSGASWSSEVGFFSRGFAARASAPGDSATVTYWCSKQHDLYLGTSLYLDRGMVSVSVDGDAATTLDCYLANEPPVVTRRRLRAAVAPGQHTVKLTLLAGKNAASSNTFFYLDFIEAAVASDVPDAAASLANVSPALDYDTDHTYKLPPQRVMNIFDQCGWHGPMNEYMGVFWWNQRISPASVFPQVQCKISGTFADQDQVIFTIGGQATGKTVFPGESNALIARHCEYFINETYSGVWAAAADNGDGTATLTITSRSPTPAYNFTFSSDVQSTAGLVDVQGSLQGGVVADWIIDPEARPVLNYAVRKWHADLYAEVKKRGRTITTAQSMELVNPPDNPPGAVWAARFRGGTVVDTDTGFAGLRSTQCPPMAAAFLAYQQQSFLEIAQLQQAAGLTAELQCGEFLWWFFTNYNATSNPNGGMAYYDAETGAAAQAALGRPLATFLTPDDDPAVNGYADANWLAGRLRDHVAAIRTHVQQQVPGAKFEVLFPYDVNYPSVYGPNKLGGKLNHYVNFPKEWGSKAASGLDRIKIEALDFGAGTRSLDLAKQAINVAMQVGWSAEDVRYLFPIFNGGCPWEWEWAAAAGAGVFCLVPFALDHMCLFGWHVGEPILMGLAQIT